MASRQSMRQDKREPDLLDYALEVSRTVSSSKAPGML